MAKPAPPCQINPARWGVLVPAYDAHFTVLDRLVQKTIELSADRPCVRMFSILSDSQEVAAFEEGFAPSARELVLLSLDEVLQRRVNSTAASLKDDMIKRGVRYCMFGALADGVRRGISSIKKIYGLLEMHDAGITHAWVLDADSLPLRPFAFARIFNDFIERPRLIVVNMSHELVNRDGVNSAMYSRRCGFYGVGINRARVPLVSLRATDYWMYRLTDVSAMVQHVEDQLRSTNRIVVKENPCQHACTPSRYTFADVYARFPCNEYYWFGAYMTHVAPVDRRPELVIMPNAVQETLDKLGKDKIIGTGKGLAGLSSDVSRSLFDACKSNTGWTSHLPRDVRLSILTSPPLSWVQGWRFDNVGPNCRADAEALLREATHITWATSNFYEQINFTLVEENASPQEASSAARRHSASISNAACTRARAAGHLGARHYSEWRTSHFGRAALSPDDELVNRSEASTAELSNLCVPGTPECASLQHSLSVGPYGRVPLISACELKSMGKTGVERKLFCQTPELLSTSNCRVVSIGSAGEWAFESDVVRRTNCSVDVFDCTGAFSVPRALRSRVKFHRVCVGPARVGFWYRQNTSQKEQGWRDRTTLSWREALELAGLGARPPSLLKIDCEGCEVEVFQEVLAAGHQDLLPVQIAIELHSPLNIRAEATSCGVGAQPWPLHFTRIHEVWPVPQFLSDLYSKAGYVVASSLPGYKWQCYCCSETLLVRTRCVGEGQGACVTLQSAMCESDGHGR